MEDEELPPDVKKIVKREKRKSYPSTDSNKYTFPDPKSRVDYGKRHVEDLTELEWGEVEGLAKVQCTLYEIAGRMEISDFHLLERLIHQRYGVEAKEWIESKRNEGRASFRANLFNMACDGKHPIVSIFCAKNWLGMIDERSIKTDENKDDVKTNKALTVISSLLDRISNAPGINQRDVTRIEDRNRRVEEAEYNLLNSSTPVAIPASAPDQDSNTVEFKREEQIPQVDKLDALLYSTMKKSANHDS